MHKRTDAEIERLQVECIYGLGGGELAEPDEWDGGPRYWFEGTPEETGMDLPLPDGFDPADGEYRCIVHPDGTYGLPSPPEGWERIQLWNFAESDCWWCGPGSEYHAEHGEPDHGCDLCCGMGAVYLGEGRLEVIRREVQ